MGLINTLQKIQSNLFSFQAVSVLGPKLYVRYLKTFFINITAIIKTGSLCVLDAAMGGGTEKYKYRGRTFLFDCQFCDEHLKEKSFSFGIVREICIRDCYFKWHPRYVFDQARTVIDLGANRGVFSTLMRTRAEFILSVECGEQYISIIHHNMNINNFSKYAIEKAMIGSGGAFADCIVPKVTMDELFQCYNLEIVDLMKIDIEGSEYALFESADWLNKVKAISMEVHPNFGNPSTILNVIKHYGFTCVMADGNLNKVKTAEKAIFIYAWKNIQ